MTSCDVLVIGAGIAGASAACAIARDRTTIMVEMEEQPGYHSTGRSAALLISTYGDPLTRALTGCSRRFLEDPAELGSESPLLSPRGLVWIADPDSTEHLLGLFEAAQSTVADLRLARTSEILALCPQLRPEFAAIGMIEQGASEIDVHALHHAYLRSFTRFGGELVTRSPIQRIEYRSGRWRASTPSGEFIADVVVNAAGAWAGEVGRLAGAARLDLVPCRRTVIAFDPGISAANYPCLVDALERFYLKPEGARLLASPADETPSEPCDCQPEELDVALAADWVTRVSTFEVGRISHRWAGLRTFAPDRLPVIGWDGLAPNFLWLAGLGGYGIMVSPATARIAASLVAHASIPEELALAGIDVARLSPRRFATRKPEPGAGSKAQPSRAITGKVH